MQFTPVSISILALFCISAGVHLFCCWKGSPKSAYTKPLLVSLLALFYVFAAGRFSPVLLAALLASWAGDVLLMPKGNRWFVTGGVSFLLSHILFIFVYTPHIVWGRVIWWIAAPVFCAYIAVSAWVMRAIGGNAPKQMRVPLFLYLAANSVMNLFALMMLLSAPSPGAAVAYAGAVCFFASDCVLFLSRYLEKKDRIPRSGFLIMLTYIAGEALITFGMLLA